MAISPELRRAAGTPSVTSTHVSTSQVVAALAALGVVVEGAESLASIEITPGLLVVTGFAHDASGRMIPSLDVDNSAARWRIELPVVDLRDDRP